jgi:hypothetical protein
MVYTISYHIIYSTIYTYLGRKDGKERKNYWRDSMCEGKEKETC